MRYFIILVLAFFLSLRPSMAAEPVPGDACATAGATMAGNNSGVGHFMLCESGTWKSVYSYNATGNLTKLGNQSCASGQILKFDGSIWACSADNGLTALPPLTATNIWVGNASNAATAVALSGDGTLSNAGALTIGTGAVTSAKILDGSIVPGDTAFVGTLTEGKWCRVSSGKIECTADAPTAQADCTQLGEKCNDGSILAGVAGNRTFYVPDVNQSTGIKWATVNQANSGAMSDTDGKANQAWIVANRTLSQYPAFELCENLVRHGHDDWYLPAPDELNAIYLNALVIGGISGACHWASAEREASWADFQNFDDGLRSSISKSSSCKVRCARRAP